MTEITDQFEWEESITIELIASGMPKQFQERIITALRLLDLIEKTIKDESFTYLGIEYKNDVIKMFESLLNQAKGEKK